MKYTRKQILEAIQYWKKQLRLNESIEWEGAKEDIEDELAERNDIPNYLKIFIKEDVLQTAGTDGIGFHDWYLDGFVRDYLKERIITVLAIWDDGDNDEDGIEVTGLPLKFTQNDLTRKLQQMYPDRHDIYASSFSIEFPKDGIFFYVANGCYADPQWRTEIQELGDIPIKLDSNGDASRIFWGGRDTTITDSYDIA